MEDDVVDVGGVEAFTTLTTTNNQEGPVVEDVTEQFDAAYDGDVEGQLPDECEEAESDSESGEKRQPANEASLINDFRSLRCATPKLEYMNQEPSTEPSARKRTISQMLSDSDQEILETSRASTPTFKRPRRRLKDIQDRMVTAPARPITDLMDVDSIPTSSHGPR